MKRDYLDDMTMHEAVLSGTFCFHIGYTWRTLDEEAYAWPSARGDNNGGKNRPVLQLVEPRLLVYRKRWQRREEEDHCDHQEDGH